MTTERVPLSEREQYNLKSALEQNTRGAALLTDSKDTSYRGVADEVPDEEVISAIKSVPTHY